MVVEKAFDIQRDAVALEAAAKVDCCHVCRPHSIPFTDA
jgi:hypothetical protein